MADYTTIRQDILNRITENGEGEITGLDLQGILLDMVDTTSGDIEEMQQRIDDFFAASNLNDVIDNWTELESFLAGLTDTSTLVELLSYKADKVDVYTKTEADALFEFKANLKALAYKDSVSMGDISGLTDALALKLDKSGGTITGDLGVDGILTMGTLRLPNASGVSGNFDLYVGSLGSGSDIPEGGGGTISYVAIKFVGENTPYEIDANGVITLPPYPDISHLATKVELTDGLATKQDVISDLATIRAGATAGAAAATPGYVDQKIADLIGSAPETLDTLQELAEALQNDAEVIDAINASIQQKANQSDLTALATRVGTAEGAITTLQGYFSNGIAKKATADADGNVITTTYYRKDGGTIGGNAYVQGELTMNTLFLPNSSNVPSAYSLYVGSLGAGSDVPSSGGDGDTVVFTPIDSNYGTLSINGTQVGALSINGHTHSQYQLQITTSNKLAYSLISGTPTSLPASDVYDWAKKSSLAVSDVPNLSWNKITSDKPTTLAGYGITDALRTSGGTIDGALKVNGNLFTDNVRFNREGVTQILAAYAGLNYDLSYYDGSTWERVLTSKNYSSYALPLSGGRIEGNNDMLHLNGIDNTYILFELGYLAKASLGYYNNFAYVANETNYARIGVADNGEPQYWPDYTGNTKHTIIHSGNIGSYAPIYNTNGNVLIGTTADSGEKLQVNGSLRVQRYEDRASYLNITVSDIQVQYNGWDTGDGYVYHDFFSNGNQIARIDGLDNSIIAYRCMRTPLIEIASGLSTMSSISTISNCLSFNSIGNEMCFSGNDNEVLYINYRPSHVGVAPVVWRWQAGSSTSWAQMEMGNIYAYGNISASGYQLPTSAPSNPVSGGYYLYVGSLGAGATIS